MNTILNPDRTRKNIVSVDEATARSPECPIDILPEDIFVTDAPPVPDEMHTPRLTLEGVWEEANPEAAAATAVATLASQVRQQRDSLLAACDYIIMPDYPLADKAPWEAYRQALRDITSQPGFPSVIEWPIKPA